MSVRIDCVFNVNGIRRGPGFTIFTKTTSDGYGIDDLIGEENPDVFDADFK